MKSALLSRMAAVLKIDEVVQCGTARDEVVFILRLDASRVKVDVPLGVASVSAMMKILCDAADRLNYEVARERSLFFMRSVSAERGREDAAEFIAPIPTPVSGIQYQDYLDYVRTTTSAMLGVPAEFMSGPLGVPAESPSDKLPDRFAAIAEEMKETT